MKKTKNTKNKKYHKCLACKKAIRVVGIHYYGKRSCLDCYNKAIKTGMIKPLTLRYANY